MLPFKTSLKLLLTPVLPAELPAFILLLNLPDLTQSSFTASVEVVSKVFDLITFLIVENFYTASIVDY